MLCPAARFVNRIEAIALADRLPGADRLRHRPRAGDVLRVLDAVAAADDRVGTLAGVAF